MARFAFSAADAPSQPFGARIEATTAKGFMRFHRILATAGAVVALASVSACSSLPSGGSPQGAGELLRTTLHCEKVDIATPPEVAQVEAMGMKGINGGGECDDPAVGGGDADFLTIEDMEAFQTAVKKDKSEQDDLMIGDDFAVDPGSDDQRRKLLDAGLVFLNCAPGFHAPEGKTTDDGEVDGCVTTDYSDDLD